MNCARYSGLRRSGAATVTPALAKRSRTSGVSTTSLVAPASRRTIASGVPLGKTKALQVLQSRSGRPCSCARPGSGRAPQPSGWWLRQIGALCSFVTSLRRTRSLRCACAASGHAARHPKELPTFHSITSSARASSWDGTSMPSACAVLTLMTKSNFVGCSTGRSAGLAPLIILSTYMAERRNKPGMLAP